MKAPLFCFAFAFSAASLVAAEIQPGISLEQALATLGSPRGRLQVGDRSLVYFERGEIEVQDGRVTRVDLKTPEEHASLRAREEEQRSMRAARHEQLVAAGIAERDRKLADENFRSAPVAYQVAYWQDFASRYPDVSVVEPLTIARIKYNEHLEEKQRKEREQQRREEREEQELAAQRDRSEVYPLYTSYGYGRYRPYNSPSFVPTYTFFPSPLPPYSTPSGNPAGGRPLITTPKLDPGIYRRGN
jgi:hypothetical protein